MASPAPDVILNVGLAFLFITAASWLAAKINYSSIPFLIFTGMLVGPYAPEYGAVSFKIISETESIELLSRFGVLLLLFYLGLEFSAGKLAEVGKNLFKGGVLYVVLNFARGLGFGWIFFHSWPVALVVAGVTGVSSSAIITKLLVDLKRTANPETELILGIMVFEDVFIAIYLSALSGILTAGFFDVRQTVGSAFLILGFIVALIAFGRRIGAFFEKRLKPGKTEVFAVGIFTLLLLAGILVEKLHVAEAIGALLLGLVMAETTHSHRVIQMITPMRDLFGAMFFFAFGMAIDYRVFGEVAFITAVAVLMTVVGNIAAGLLASWLSGHRKRRAVNVAFTIIARGEFSIILASFAAASGLSSDLPAFAALYVLVLAFISPVLARNTRLFYEIFEKGKGLFKKTPVQS